MLIREEVVESLLNRQILKPDTTLISTFLSGKAVLVAGAGGTIGAALCNQIIQQQPATLVLYEFSEPALQAITGQLRQVLSAQKQVSRLKIVPVLASINDTPRLKAALQHHRIDIIFMLQRTSMSTSSRKMYSRVSRTISSVPGCWAMSRAPAVSAMWSLSLLTRHINLTASWE